MPYSSPELRRVCVRTPTGSVDLTLPADVPVAVVIPDVLDVLDAVGLIDTDRDGPAVHRLCPPGRSPLDGAETLAQQQIRDGALLLLLIGESPAGPQPRFDDPVDQIAAAARSAARPWTAADRRLTATLAAAGLAGVAGFLAAPGALPAGTAVACVAMLTVPVSGCSPAVRAMLCGLTGLAVGAAVVTTAAAAAGVPLQAPAAVAVAGALAATRFGARIAMAVTGLARRPVRAPDAHRMLTGVIGGCSATLLLSAVGVVAGRPVGTVPPLAGAALLACAGAGAVLQARHHTDRCRIAALLTGGAGTVGAALLAAARGAPEQRPVLCAAAAVLAAAAVTLGFSGLAGSPPVRRAGDLAHRLALAALPALTCWVCGGYAALRGLASVLGVGAG